MADTTAALNLVNTIHHQLAALARSIVNASQSGGVTALEGLTLGMQAMQLGTEILSLVEGSDPATQQQVLDILEHGTWTMPA